MSSSVPSSTPAVAAVVSASAGTKTTRKSPAPGMQRMRARMKHVTPVYRASKKEAAAISDACRRKQDDKQKQKKAPLRVKIVESSEALEQATKHAKQVMKHITTVPHAELIYETPHDGHFIIRVKEVMPMAMRFEFVAAHKLSSTTTDHEDDFSFYPLPLRVGVVGLPKGLPMLTTISYTNA